MLSSYHLSPVSMARAMCLLLKGGGPLAGGGGGCFFFREGGSIHTRMGVPLTQFSSKVEKNSLKKQFIAFVSLCSILMAVVFTKNSCVSIL